MSFFCLAVLVVDLFEMDGTSILSRVPEPVGTVVLCSERLGSTFSLSLGAVVFCLWEPIRYEAICSTLPLSLDFSPFCPGEPVCVEVISPLLSQLSDVVVFCLVE